MEIKKATKNDFVEIHKLLLGIFHDATANIGEMDEFFVAKEKEEILGFAHFSEDGEKIILKGLGVAEKCRKTGVGGALLAKLTAHAKRKGKDVYLKTTIRNPALRLYCKKGFCFKGLKGETLTLALRNKN